MKFVGDRPFSDPAVATRKLLELANAVEPVHDARIHIEKINGPFLTRKAAHLRSTRPGSTTPSPRAGSGCTSPAPTWSSPRPVRSCSRDRNLRQWPCIFWSFPNPWAANRQH